MATMKAVRWYGPRDMRLEDTAKPEPKPHEALLRIESVGVCGSDIHYYTHGRIGFNALTGPTILGHEYAGVVEAVGSEANPSLVGKRVAVEPGIPCLKCEWCQKGHYNVCLDMTFPGGPGQDGALSEYFCVHAGFVHPVPDSIPADVAAMIEPLAVAVHTVEMGHLRPGDNIAVFGLGPIGLLTAQVASNMGTDTIIGADLHPYRVDVSKEFGVDEALLASEEVNERGAGETVDRIMELTGGRGVDVAFDCTNGATALAMACHVTRPAGHVAIVGISGENMDYLPPDQPRKKELSLQWVRRFCFNYPASIRMIERGKVDVRKLITHSFPLDRASEAFEIVAGYKDNVLKASIDQ